MFDYDVFLSFASGEEEKVRPIWQKLSLNGLRVFWSDTALKQSLGESWSAAIETALERSRHFLLIVSPLSMSSPWVRREYNAFFNYCYQPSVRRLIPVILGTYSISQLPLFLRDLQAMHLTEGSIEGLINLLGGTSIDQLKKQLTQKEEENHRLVQQFRKAEENNNNLVQQLREAQKANQNLERRLYTADKELNQLKLKLGSTRLQKGSSNQGRLLSKVPSSNRFPLLTEVLMPQMGEEILVGTITKWLKKIGDHVQRDEPLFEISTEKVDAEIPAPVAGVLAEIKFKEGATVDVNTVVALIEMPSK